MYTRFLPNSTTRLLREPTEVFPSREVAGRALKLRAKTGESGAFFIGQLRPRLEAHRNRVRYSDADHTARLAVWLRRAADRVPSPGTDPDEVWTLTPLGAIVRSPYVPDPAALAPTPPPKACGECFQIPTPTGHCACSR